MGVTDKSETLKPNGLSSCAQKLQQVQVSMSRHLMHIPMLQQSRPATAATMKTQFELTRLHEYDTKMQPNLNGVRSSTQKLRVRLLCPGCASVCHNLGSMPLHAPVCSVLSETYTCTHRQPSVFRSKCSRWEHTVAYDSQIPAQKRKPGRAPALAEP